MQLIRKFFKSNNTYIKYFLSYLIIVTVLILGFLFVVRKQMIQHFFDQRRSQAQIQLDTISAQLNKDISSLSIVDSYLESDLELITFRHSASADINRNAQTELEEYAATSPLISSIVFLQSNSSTPLSTHLPVYYQNSIFQIGSTQTSGEVAYFDPSPYFNVAFGQLVAVPTDSSQMLLYFPPLHSTKRYLYFYILDSSAFIQQFESLITEETPAIALLNQNKEVITGIHSDLLSPYLDSLTLVNGIFSINDSVSLCVHTDIIKNFSMVFLLSNDALHKQIDSVFAESYLTIMLLSVAGFFLILLAMRITYLPLHRLTHKIVPVPVRGQNYFHQIESAFANSEDEILHLKSKLDSYQNFMHKSLFESSIPFKDTGNRAAQVDIDSFFDPNAHNLMFVLKFHFTATPLSWDALQGLFLAAFPANMVCILLESEAENISILINYTGDEMNVAEQIKKLCSALYEAQGILSIISVSSDSLLDIPFLRKRTGQAVSLWENIPVVDLSNISVDSQFDIYPHEQLLQLSEVLTNNQFHAAGKIIDELFALTGYYAAAPEMTPQFLAQCIIIDMLTVIINYMNMSHIKFHSYSNIYFETLFFCRSCPYEEKAEEIAANLHRLVDLCEQKITRKFIDSEQFLQVIRESYCDPNFSISTLADKFNISSSYMSLLFKQELHMNFSDYLATLRIDRAKELLHTTDMSVDEISGAVGYTNVTSFGRKFKQEVGLTPTQYRAGTEP